MSATTTALIVNLVGALVSTAALLGPPSLPPQDAAGQQPPPTSPPEGEPPQAGGQPSGTPPAGTPPPPRDALPPGLQPIPFPLETQRRTPPPPGTDAVAPPPAATRRSLVDLRDPFDRPPVRPREAGGNTPMRLLMPDLKDPFAPGVRRIRSKTLDQRIPNDIIDPFRAAARGARAAACAKTTKDGTVVQRPGQTPVVAEECRPSKLDLRDPFDREPGR